MITLNQLSELDELMGYLTAPELAEMEKLLRQEQMALPPPSVTRQQELIELCKENPWEFVNRFCWTYDPREADPSIPFNLFKRQEEFLQWLKAKEAGQEDGIAEKCRDVGFSWLCCAYALHGWLFRPGFKCGFGSRKQELVDRLGDPDCIFEKIRFLRDKLPQWMMPKGFNRRVHDGIRKIINPANGASIIGEGGDNIGRGGRTTVYFLDEAAFIARPKKVDAALSQNSRCKIYVSTPNGLGNPFAQKRHSGKFDVFTFRWWQDPRKDAAWYQKQKDTLDPVVLAQEVDIDYAASMEGICIPAKWVQAAVGLGLPATGPREAGADIAERGGAKTVMVDGCGPVIENVHAFPSQNTTQTAWTLADECQKRGIQSLAYDCNGVGAGVRGTFDSSEKRLLFETFAVQSGGSPSEAVWPDGKTSKEKFVNRRAELWWKLRTRFEKTYEYVVEGITTHPLDELISIPNHPDLIMQLSLPLYFKTDTGKVLIESKQAMSKRGVASPDFADALMFRFAVENGWSGAQGIADALSAALDAMNGYDAYTSGASDAAAVNW